MIVTFVLIYTILATCAQMKTHEQNVSVTWRKGLRKIYLKICFLARQLFAGGVPIAMTDVKSLQNTYQIQFLSTFCHQEA